MGRAPCCDKANVKKVHGHLKRMLRSRLTLKNLELVATGLLFHKKWSIIAAQLPGRTDNDIKNYWNTRLKKKLLGRRKQSNSTANGGQDPNHDAINGGDHQNLSNSALERLQLHMQLQNLQNPFSFYNNPALWPKLNPFQEKTLIQSLQSFNNIESPLMQQHLLPGSQSTTTADPLAFQQNYPQFSNPNVHELDNSLNGMSSSDSSIRVSDDNKVIMDDHSTPPLLKANDLQSDAMNIQPALTFQADELENFLNNKTIGYTAEEDDHQIAQFDCFNAVNGSKDNFFWWDSKSASSNSWDSTPVLDQSEGMFQDFELGYNL
ncbi:hypothetical protein LWI28_001252 [Acer negundo]|uniref:Uncharacterized protein n=1 Tax=Acer negundo TaxID=4023 RepID=A0AAD5NY84_ACENE|nr:hypothetical protein LWI28_001252 [Acer negundo]